MGRFDDEASIVKSSSAWFFVLGAMAVLFAYQFTWRGGVDLAPMLAFLAAVVYGVVEGSRAPKRRSRKRRAFTVDERGLTVEGANVLPRKHIVRANIVRGADDSYSVHLIGDRPWRTHVVFVDYADKANALVAALDLPDSQEGVMRYRAHPPWARRFRALAVVLGVSPWVFAQNLRVLPQWVNAIVFALYAMLLLPAILPLRVTVGDDGIFLQWLGKRRLIAFSEIRAVSASKLGVDLVLTSDKIEEIRFTQRAHAADAAIADLVKRIEKGIAKHQSAAAIDEAALLARGKRDLETWLRDMRALGSGVSGYRVAMVPRERLWTVLESTSSDPSAREGAALALSAEIDDAERARLAALAQRTVRPRLRVALEEVSKERDEARLRISLEELETLGTNEEEEPGEGLARARETRQARR